MNIFRYITRSIRFYKKQHIGLFLTTMLATAILTGALIVGDSVVFSLQKLVELRLGNVQYAMSTGDRFVTTSLGTKMGNDLNTEISSILITNTIAINPEKGLRKNKVQLVGIDSSFVDLALERFADIKGDEVVISQNLADALSLTMGDRVLLRIDNNGIIPVNAPFAEDKEPNVALRVIVKDIAGVNNLARFSLQNDQKPPYNIFISYDVIASKLKLENKTNCILTGKNSKTDVNLLNENLAKNFTPNDAGLIISSNDNTTDIRSERIFIDHFISSRVSKHDSIIKVFTYFVNNIGKNDKTTPYSFVSAVSDNFFKYQIGDKEIILNEWLANDIKATINDTINLKYYRIDNLNNISEHQFDFIVSDIIPVENSEYYRSLMPDFPGLSDANSCGDWEAGIPIDLSLIRDKDEDYWNEFKGTPKAFISLSKGQQIWENNFGNLSIIRIKGEQKLTGFEDLKIHPSDLGFEFKDLIGIGKQSASNGVDFGQLFLSLSFFLIFSALLLMALLNRLNLLARNSETGILTSLGFGFLQILKIRIVESFFILFSASIFGGFLGIAYNKLVISALNSVWNEAVHADMIVVKIMPATVISGIMAGLLICLLIILIQTRRSIKKLSAISIVRKTRSNESKPVLSLLLFVISFIATGYLIIFQVIYNNVIDPTVLLSAAFAIIIMLVSLFTVVLSKLDKKINYFISGKTLAIKNIARNKNRAVTSVLLIAIGVFTIFVTGANRLTFNDYENQRNSGTGGFNYWIETTIPLSYDLNDSKGQLEYGFESNSFKDISFIQIPKKDGDDASCLNLNQVQTPSILGIDPLIFDSLNAFDFAKSLNIPSAHWKELLKFTNDSVVPAIADQTVIDWGLIKKLGDTITYINEYGKPLKMVLVAGLKPSIFQGNLLIYDSVLIANFPSSAGTDILLVDTPDNNDDFVSLFKRQLSDFGVEITSTSDRLAGFYSVTNTYLAIFLVLGGLGVILGTLGFGLIMIRNLLERQNELTIYSALGFTRITIVKSIIIENIIIFSTGLIIGLISAFVGILPSILSQSYSIPGNTIFIILGVLIINVLLWIIVPAYIFTKHVNYLNLKTD